MDSYSRHHVLTPDALYMRLDGWMFGCYLCLLSHGRWFPSAWCILSCHHPFSFCLTARPFTVVCIGPLVLILHKDGSRAVDYQFLHLYAYNFFFSSLYDFYGALRWGMHDWAIIWLTTPLGKSYLILSSWSFNGVTENYFTSQTYQPKNGLIIGSHYLC